VAEVAPEDGDQDDRADLGEGDGNEEGCSHHFTIMLDSGQEYCPSPWFGSQVSKQVSCSGPLVLGPCSNGRIA
jgi:hypothetical protein